MPPEEELPSYPGHSKQRKTPSRDPVVLSRQQQAEANRVKIRERIARSYGATEPGVKKLISAVNLGYHWGAFYVDVERKQCFLFDPMQLKSNIVAQNGGVHCRRANAEEDGPDPQDSSSCGLWCLVVLELLLFGATHDKWSNYWSDSLYEAGGYLRMRYLHKVINLQSHFPVEDEPEEEK
ncbi:hypothetical protein GN958_ATG06463 [Phytophthora infestans]|uniref:Ubiquitin-like protease family profile domain-containing protein n=1 Tax=Phytophthora infestans TaxID=4787 RepID=A0A8S9UZH6_PHYIN|nr:hypothetical protein GN958_ATG06463 [Phytophthora infestans]